MDIVTDQKIPENPVDWDYIIRTIKQGKCIIVMGPGLARTTAKQRFLTSFVESLDIDKNERITSFYAHEELFLFPNAQQKTRIVVDMEEFYEKDFFRTPYEILSQLPVKLFINASPDHFLARVMEASHPAKGMFHKGDPQRDFDAPSVEQPLIYNLVGDIYHEESLLLTHDDLFEFIEAVLANQKLPQVIKDELFSARSLIFLGLSFDKWYVQLLLRLLKVHDPNTKFTTYSTFGTYNEETLSICTQQFRIEFIDHGVDAFLDELEQRCDLEGGILLDRGAMQEERMERNLEKQAEVKNLIREDELEEALNEMETEFRERKDQDKLDELLALQGRRAGLDNEEAFGHTDPEARKRERNAIRLAAIKLANHI